MNAKTGFEQEGGPFWDPRVTANIHAAGAVLWRESSTGAIEIALVHRPKYEDWSLPKGKLDPGETPVLAAVREVREETGLESRLGRYLGHVTYPIPGHRKLKRVDYWAAEQVGGEFTVNSEVDVLSWHPLDRVMDQLSYPMDRQVVRAFTRLPARTQTVLLVRHAKAGRRDRFNGPDDQRPLDRDGEAQAQALTSNLLAFGASEVYSAPPLRCVQSVAPLAEKLGVEIIEEPLLSESGYAENPDQARERFRALVSDNAIRVVCSQGKVIPDLLGWLAERDGIALPSARNRKGSVWVLSFVGHRLVAADHLDRSLSAYVVRSD
ncbi:MULTISPECIES: NUDIX hydrolase [Nocardia]|uniref:Bifunctional NUDIX hydrolase/histidine phosphatase family protein n=1 Tax=Nocardia implantans TaxID=3108168 RepID=A0ABU6ATD5_9NOCA|nr:MULTISPECIES: bifunctional NUDIX hydrolase/histidine phosphatase family protein [unclassified Nocardia]MBF6191061.1 NUDIX hydrolase [Nocardia beijingensis]MEA3529058.1 bifunctional NUDIX hydrolase/histidine phosphatase family protein [Nocardia sp. CDC192]MEB3510723.1 bifunctional NUDIX hydrolase/histidine phosphatase family protein [Nocardia sp. CDC186]